MRAAFAVHHACQLAPYDGQKFAESAPEPESKSTPVSPERRPEPPVELDKKLERYEKALAVLTSR